MISVRAFPWGVHPFVREHAPLAYKSTHPTEPAERAELRRILAAVAGGGIETHMLVENGAPVGFALVRVDPDDAETLFMDCLYLEPGHGAWYRSIGMVELEKRARFLGCRRIRTASARPAPFFRLIGRPLGFREDGARGRVTYFVKEL